MVDPQNPDHYLRFEDVYGSATSEKDKPSSKRKQQKSHNMPFNPSAQTANRVNFLAVCIESKKPRVIHAAKKLTPAQLKMLERELEAMDFKCGAELQNFCDSDSDLDFVHTCADLCCQEL
jgi:hypothetical protein